METEVRFYYSTDSKYDIINYLKRFKDIEYKGRFHEITDQYNHPMNEYNFYSKEIDGRFRIRKSVKENESKCMITWKRRLKNKNSLVHEEEEKEVRINSDDYDNLCFILTNVLHLEIVESYERYRNVFNNSDVEIVLDEYPFGVCIEIETKSKNKDAKEVINYYLNELKLNINDAYTLSWDDKYDELCKKENKTVNKIVRFNMEMPKETNKFNIDK